MTFKVGDRVKHYLGTTGTIVNDAMEGISYGMPDGTQQPGMIIRADNDGLLYEVNPYNLTIIE